MRRTNVGGVIRSAENELRCPVIPGADITDVWLASDQYLCRTEIAKLEDTGGRVEE